ncbi:hypothetical protein FRB96_003874 [Tulasnella sp. 330]|nr:hypothetical protein FRB96_003874 [Tulasnella sp. 330]KAG8882089.1 hypothetical protein FRB98_003926 [Tulasnella sp. 332]
MADTEENAYTLLELEITATEAEIRKAYRQRSLKVHPDRHPNNPKAAQKFHELNTAYELLLDPIQKAALDAKIKAQQAKKLRFSAYDNKRKAMMEELEKSERDFKKSRGEAERERENTIREEERIKEEGRRMMKEKEERMVERETDRFREAKGKERENDDEPPIEALGNIMQTFGAVDMSSIVLSLKVNKKNPSKPPKSATALVPFVKIVEAFSAVMASGRKEKGLNGVEICWVESQEPALVTWLRDHGQLGIPMGGRERGAGDRAAGTSATPIQETRSSQFSSFPDDLSTNPRSLEPPPPAPGLDFESLTFMRMRQAERERLEREILEAEAQE